MEPRIKYWRPKIARQLHEEMVNDCCFKGVGGKDMEYENPQQGDTVRFDWRNMDTSGASHYADDHLLYLVQHLPVVEYSGFGLIAELCKRFKGYIEHSFPEDLSKGNSV